MKAMQWFLVGLLLSVALGCNAGTEEEHEPQLAELGALRQAVHLGDEQVFGVDDVSDWSSEGGSDVLLDDLDFGIVQEPPEVPAEPIPVTLKSVSFELAPGASLENVALASGQEVRIADGQEVFGVISNQGSGQTELGADSVVDGSVLSRGEVFAKSRARVTEQVVTIPPVQQEDGVDIVGGVITGASFEPPVRVQWTVPVPTVAGSDLTLPPDSTATLDEQTFASVTVFSRATLTIPGGIYFLDSLIVEPEATLALQTNERPVVIYVLSRLDYKGQLSFDGPSDRFLIVYLGEAQTSLENDFSGAVLAANAPLRLAPERSFSGQFLAKQGLNVEARGSVTLVPSTAWNAAIPVVPILACVDAVGGGKFSARFGYENRAGLAFHLPKGPQNQLVPEPLSGAGPTEDFAAAGTEGAFRAAFPVGDTMAWELLGQTAKPTGGEPACQSTVASQSSTAAAVGGDGPRGVSVDAPQFEPFEFGNCFFSGSFNDPADLGDDPSDTGPSVPLLVSSTRVTLRATGISGSDDCVVGSFDPFVEANLEGRSVVRTELPRCAGMAGNAGCDPNWPGAILLDETLDPSVVSFDLAVEFWERDTGFLCGSNDLLERLVHTLDLTQDRIESFVLSDSGDPQGGFLVLELEVVTGASRPDAPDDFRLCVDWPAEFVDPGGSLGEEYPRKFRRGTPGLRRPNNRQNRTRRRIRPKRG